jgi:pyridoxamine 5'-phosphate oxidase
MEHVGDLEARIAEHEKQFASEPVPRPPFWSGFRLVPDVIEFWYGKPSRLHERQQFVRDDDGWRVARLYP